MRQYEIWSEEHQFYLSATEMFGEGEDQDEFEPDAEVETEESVDDPQAVRVYQFWANELVSKFTAVCDRPFYVEISAYPRKGNDPYNVAIVATYDGEGFVINPDESMEGIELLGKIQDFVKYDFSSPEEDFLGSINIDVYMQYLEKDGEKVEDPAIDVLADLAFVSFYEAVDVEFCTETVRVQYINAPDLVNWDEDEDEDSEGEDAEEDPDAEESPEGEEADEELENKGSFEGKENPSN